MPLPIDTATLAAFAATVTAIVVSPGPDTMLILRSALISGAGAGFAAVAGVQLGLLLHTILAILGVSALIASSPALFHGVAIAGAVYLAWIGVGGFRAQGGLRLQAAGPSLTALACCRDAMITNLLNPKVIVLYLALYPNFIRPQRGQVSAQLITLTVVLIGVNTSWQMGLAWFADRARGWLRHPPVQLWIGRITGGILIGFAAILLWEHLRAVADGR